MPGRHGSCQPGGDAEPTGLHQRCQGRVGALRTRDSTLLPSRQLHARTRAPPPGTYHQFCDSNFQGEDPPQRGPQEAQQAGNPSTSKCSWLVQEPNSALRVPGPSSTERTLSANLREQSVSLVFFSTGETCEMGGGMSSHSPGPPSGPKGRCSGWAAGLPRALAQSPGRERLAEGPHAGAVREANQTPTKFERELPT